ncbi:hypothetical protein [Snuella lapsa]|uniref:Uncharacterized protein n=1 Tax=Snuella lapsa TaxID=870481 RepID=A0ABP6YAK4_9FLAO
MRQFFLVLISLSLLCSYSCDDGDIITVEISFGETFEVCGNNGLVLYKTKEDPSESLSLRIASPSGLTIDDLLEVGNDNTLETRITLSTTNTLNYRTYSNEKLPSNLFCNDIPPSDVNITQDYVSTAGEAIILTTLIEDDNDGIPAELEGMDPNGDGNYDDALDTDGDGLPNYLDIDDDGDNILTKDEDIDPNGDKNFDDALDTDGDGIPNYLDNDDDGDGVLTRDEENESQDNNPANDKTNSDVGPDYLNKDVATTVPATAYRQHTIYEQYVVTMKIINFNLEFISMDELDFGILEHSSLSTNRKETPDFN